MILKKNSELNEIKKRKFNKTKDEDNNIIIENYQIFLDGNFINLIEDFENKNLSFLNSNI